LCGQWALLVVAAAAISEIGGVFSSSWRTSPQAIRAGGIRIGVLLLFQLPAVWVFLGWGALTAPRFAGAHSLVLTPGHAVGVLAILGFTFSWWAGRRIARVSPLNLAMLAVFLPLLYLGLPVVSQYQGPEQITGLSTRLLSFAGAWIGFDTPILLVPAAFLALVMLKLTLRVDSISNASICLAILLLMVGFSGSAIVGESHIRLLPPLLFIAAVALEPPDWTLRMLVAQSSALGVAYAVYHAVFKFV
jgi:hypothetical protein